jgi:hypothetical protein
MIYTIAREDSEKPDMVSISDNSEEPVEELIKQGAGDLLACGPSTFINVDSFKTNGEIVSIAVLSCAAVNTFESFDVAINENVENAENVSKIDQIDLTSKNIESSTGIISVSVEIMPEPIAIADPAFIAELNAVADPVITGRVLTEINSQNQNMINLCQTISCNSTPLNVLFDSGATMTLVTKKVAELGINYENVKYGLNAIGANCFEGRGTIQVPIALPDGKAHVLKALIVDEPLGQVDMHSPPLMMWRKFSVCQWRIL